MTTSPHLLQQRLDDIGQSLARRNDGLALLGLGSAGAELTRLDAYSDLDFFAIVQPGSKTRYITDLAWLSEIAPIAYAFPNTIDGYKLLFADGIFCEFAVFEPAELAQASFTAVRIIWQAAKFDDRLVTNGKRPFPPATPSPTNEWLVGEALTNLYVGLGRFCRGEKLSAMRFIQGYAVDRLADLAPRLEAAQPSLPDPFAAERRIEQRLPQFSQHLPDFLPGYENSPAAARAILSFLTQHFPVNPAMAAEILALCAPENGAEG
ncbi:MAG: hypothetical protein KBE23_13090 [Chloroflexi bacterium]|nr:hypothetical protein [Chloroflexota bacterium]MBP7043674.1 hypothetical protein [Chloroflexota bacterium]